MIDTQNRREIRVTTDGAAGPYIMIPLNQLSQVRERLDQHAIRYWVDPDAISLDGNPAVAVINLGLSENAKAVQAILDDAA